jgi:excinuclease ABC subunit C
VAVQDTRLFLEGRNDELVAQLRGRMAQAAAEEQFEQAAQLRDALRTIETLQQRQQKMAGTALGDRDAFGIKTGPAGAVVQVFQVRGGKVVERLELVTSEPGAQRPQAGRQSQAGSDDPAGGHQPEAGRTQPSATDADVLQAALEQFYLEHPAPPEIHLPLALDPGETEVIEAWLTDRSERRVRILVPQRGEKRGLLDLAARNAQVAYQTRFNETVAAHYDALETLRVVLNLPAIPRRIECFDISTIQGSETVASMVVCEDGRMKRSEYRKFRIRGARGEARGASGEARDAGGEERDARGEARAARGEERDARGEDTAPPTSRLAPRDSRLASLDSPLAPRDSRLAPRILDDFASMHEVVSRRYRAVLEHGGPFPDLILIDGGKGQLSAAYGALEELGLSNLVATGIAKKEELLFTRDHVDPIALAPDSPALLLIQRIRDEAHRFAITFHRHSRTKRDLRSALDDIGGVGPRRRKALLTAFGSLAGVRRATREELIAVVGAKCADQVLAHFAGQT